MLITVLEPGYFPSLAECAKALQADRVIWANSFHMRRHSTINRAAIKTVNGRQWLTIPTIGKGLQEQAIHDACINNQIEWGRTHGKTIEINYRLSAYYDFVIDKLAPLWQTRYDRLDDVLKSAFRFLQSELGLAQAIESITWPAVSDRSERIIAWMKTLAADQYLIWPHQAMLIDVARLRAAGITVFAMHYTEPVYHQAFAGFISDLSVLDLVLNEGPAGREILRKAGSVRAIS